MQKKTLIFPVIALVAIGVAYLSINTKENADIKPVAFVTKKVNNNIASDNVKIGYYNSMEVVRESKTGKELTAQAEQKRNEYQAKFREAEAELAKMANDHRTKASTLSVTAREKAEQALLNKKRELEHQGKSYEENLQLLVKQGQVRVFKELTDSVYVVGRKKNVDLMKDVATGQVIVINPDKVECTTSIVKVMDASYDKQNKNDGKNPSVSAAG